MPPRDAADDISPFTLHYAAALLRLPFSLYFAAYYAPDAADAAAAC